MTITLRVEKGAPLRIPEADGNIIDLDGRVVVLEETAITARSIEEIVQIGNSLVIQYTDSTEDGPFTFDVHITFRGDWEPDTAYAVNDLLHAEGVIYLVPFAHISEPTFDPGENNGMGDNYYAAFLAMPELQLPVGGGEGDVLAKASAEDYDTEWRSFAAPAGSPVVTVSSATYTLLAANAGYYHRFTHASGCTVTVPLNTSVAITTGSEYHLRQAGFGSVVMIGEADTGDEVVINPSREGYDTNTPWVGATVTLKKVATDEWDLIGPPGEEITVSA